MKILIKNSGRWLLVLGALSVASAFLSTSVKADDKRELTDRAYQAYRDGDFIRALDLYRQAGAEIPEAAGLEYNKGTAHYQLGDFEQALKTFEKAALSENDELAAGAHYNSGNTYFQQQDFQNAVEQYKNALRKDPDDAEARLNLEIALRNLQKQEQEQDKDSEQNEDNQEDQQQDKQQDSEKNQDKEDKQDPQNQESQQDPDSSQTKPRQNPPKSNPNQMSKEDAERLLNSLIDEERKHQRNKRMASAKMYNGKDW